MNDIEDLRPGMHATCSKTLAEADIVLFAGVWGDNDAVETDEEFARATPFGGCILQGFPSASVTAAAVENRLPGPGTGCLVDSRRIFIRKPQILGSTMGSLGELRDLLALVQRSGLEPAIDSEHALDDVHGALDRLDSGAQFGEFVIHSGVQP